jgi:hypothetical protein
MCFIYVYLTLEKNYLLLKVYFLEFDIGRLGKIWIQQGRRESKKFGQLWSRQCEICNISKPYRPPWPIPGIVLLLLILTCLIISEYNERNWQGRESWVTFRILSVMVHAIWDHSHGYICKSLNSLILRWWYVNPRWRNYQCCSVQHCESMSDISLCKNMLPL